jgi:zinc transport system permease protein
LGVVAHTVLAVGLIVLSKMERIRVDLNALLFGDVLAIGAADLWAILAVGAVVYALLFLIWRQLLEITLSEEIAQVEGIAVGRVRLLYLSLLALVVAVAIKVVGMLLLMSLLIIPAAVARRFSATPERMAVLACVVGVLSVIAGLWLSVLLDWPAGAAIAAVASAFFAVSVLKK